MLDYFGHQFLILLLGVLLVEDAVLLAAEADAAKEVGGGVAVDGVKNFTISYSKYCSRSPKTFAR